MIESKLLANQGSYIAGKWTDEYDGGKLHVHDPGDGEELATLPTVGEKGVKAAIDAAADAVTRLPSIERRARWLRDTADQLNKNKDEIGRIITLENGKPLKEGIGETEYAAGFFTYAAEHLDVLDSDPLLEMEKGCTWTIHHRPIGVVGIITPWNFPLAMMAKKLAGVIAAGCSTVVRPASKTPLAPLALWQIFDKIGLDAGRVNLVLANSSVAGIQFCTHPNVAMVSFTGSTQVGRTLIEQSAPHVKKLAMELGGNAPFIVFEDANLEAAADHLISNKFRASGQTCVCANRVYVHQSVAQAFVDILAPKLRELKVGHGLNDDVTIGPLINRDAWDKVDQLVNESIKDGAKPAIRNEYTRPENEWGAYYGPTLLLNVKQDMRICTEEIFGPVITIALFKSQESVIAASNSTIHGLAAYVHTGDTSRGNEVAAQLQFGHVGLNTGSGPAPLAPFGGMKQSGFGREGGEEGILEYTTTQVVAQQMR